MPNANNHTGIPYAALHSFKNTALIIIFVTDTDWARMHSNIMIAIY